MVLSSCDTLYTGGFFTHSFFRFFKIFSRKLSAVLSMPVLPFTSRMSGDAPTSSTGDRTTSSELWGTAETTVFDHRCIECCSPHCAGSATWWLAVPFQILQKVGQKGRSPYKLANIFSHRYCTKTQEVTRDRILHFSWWLGQCNIDRVPFVSISKADVSSNRLT